MDERKDVQQLVADPSLLVALCREVIERLVATPDSAEIAGKKRELQEIDRAITSLEKIGLTPPKELVARRELLLAALRSSGAVSQPLRYLADEFKKILADLQARLNQEEPPAPQPPRPKGSRSPRTGKEVLKEQIILALQKLGGRAAAAVVVAEVGKQLHGRLTPGDLEWSEARKMYAWQHKTHWARYELTREGVLSREAPRGMWELREQQR